MGVAAAPTLTERAIDGALPSRVERPESTAELAALLASAHRSREAVVLWGGGTRIGVGETPARYDIAVDLTALRGIVEHSPADLVCTVRAGTTLAELATAVRASGQRWPVEAPLPERATVGGTIAGAAVGASRLRYLHPRDWLLGCTAVLGDGTVTRAGGRVVKNVTGYDLTRLYSGSYGTLVALAEITVKLAAIPERTLTLRASPADAATALRVAAELRATRLPLDGLAIATGDAAARVGASGAALFVRVAGPAEAVERVAGVVREASGATAHDDRVWERLAALTAEGDRVARAGWTAGHAPPADLDLTSAVVFPGSGIAFLIGAIAPSAFARMRASLEAAGGALVVERGDAAFKRDVGGAWGALRTPASVARALKTRFDPHDVLAPGRIPLRSNA